MAAAAPARRGGFWALKDFFLPPPIQPVAVPVTPINDAALTPEETAQLRRDQANAIDKYFDEELDKETYDQYNDKNRCLQWKPYITPADPEWRETRNYYVGLLTTSRIADVLDEHFEEIQKILINPQAWSEEVQAVRDLQSAEYYQNLGPGGSFEGELDNLATKLTMVHYGLPVAPMTMNNIMTLGPDWDDTQHDEPDPPLTPPRQQRIIYSERPLEFLDSYHERAWGHQTIRRPRTQTRLRGGAGSPDELSLDDDIQWGTAVNMRGGAASPCMIEVWGPYKEEQPATVTSEEAALIDACVGLLRLDPAKESSFTLSTYQSWTGNLIDKPLVGSHQVTNQNFPWDSIVSPLNLDRDNPPTILVAHEYPKDTGPPSFFEDRQRITQAFPAEPGLTDRHWIYSYFGKHFTRPRYREFKSNAFKLLGIDPTTDWTFTVDIHNPAVDPPTVTIELNRSNYRNTFVTQIRDRLRQNDVSLFVRRGDDPVSSHDALEPPPDMLNIAKLVIPASTTYWKIPLDLSEENHGINRWQNAFRRAFLAMYGDERPLRNVIVEPDCPLGIGGMEVHKHLVARLKRISNEQQQADPDNPLTCELVLNPQQSLRNRVCLRLIGSAADWSEDRQTLEADGYLGVWRQILEMLVGSTMGGFPPKIRLWFSPQEREKDIRSVVIHLFQPGTRGTEYSDDQKRAILIEAFRTHFHGACIWFRPEFDIFTIRDERGLAQHWDVRGGNNTLQAFNEALEEMWGEDYSPPDRNFVLIDNYRDEIFSITTRTSESCWRTDVFDWITTEEIYIRRKEVRIFIQPDPVLWGHRHGQAGDIDQLPEEPEPVPTLPTAGQEPRIPKSRLILPVVEKAKTPKWETWMTEQHRLDALQRRSYIRDQSVIEPGHEPAPPLYGPSRELQLTTSMSTPAIYTQRMTPTDILELFQENQKLRNGVLDRTHNCNICSVGLAGYEYSAIQAHFSKHLIQLQKEGQCPLCEQESWSIMTMEQRKEHLEKHQAEADSEMIRNFWNDIQCPVCDRKLAGYTATNVLEHFADHMPGIVEFCHKCGLRLSICTHAEQVHHRYSCLDKPDRTLSDPTPVFCQYCGLDRTNETDEEREEHVREDRANRDGEATKKFCDKCGIDETDWSEEEIGLHDDRCVSPRGTDKKFCLRCGTMLDGLNGEQLDNHRAFCATRTKEPESMKERIEELKIRTQANNRTAAKNAATLAWITGRTTELAEREDALAQREARLPPEDPARPRVHAEPNRNLGTCPYATCNFQFGNDVNRDAVYAHLQLHAQNLNPDSSFICPLEECRQNIYLPNVNVPALGTSVIEHYRHRRIHGVSDARIEIEPAPEEAENYLAQLLEIFRRSTEMHRRSVSVHASPIPEPGPPMPPPAGGAAAAGFITSEFQKSGWSFRRPGEASGGDVKKSVEVELPYDYYEHDSDLADDDYNIQVHRPRPQPRKTSKRSPSRTSTAAIESVVAAARIGSKRKASRTSLDESERSSKRSRQTSGGSGLSGASQTETPRRSVGRPPKTQEKTAPAPERRSTRRVTRTSRM